MRTMFTKPRGGLNPAIVYRGPSMIDGSPIVAIATPKSSNGKTGGMLQIWIISAAVDPITANRSGLDYSVCGNCPLKGEPHDGPKGYAKRRGCYVNLVHGPLGIFKKFTAGGYPELNRDELAEYGSGQNIRLGAYGDPAAVPRWVWDLLLETADGWTGYTHQIPHRSMAGAKGRAFARFCMVSADSLNQAREYWAQGFRTFRTIASQNEIAPGEILCPATKEGGQRTTCEKCGLCSGSDTKARNIAAVVHGAGAKHAAGAIIARAV